MDVLLKSRLALSTGFNNRFSNCSGEFPGAQLGVGACQQTIPTHVPHSADLIPINNVSVFVVAKPAVCRVNTFLPDLSAENMMCDLAFRAQDSAYLRTVCNSNVHSFSGDCTALDHPGMSVSHGNRIGLDSSSCLSHSDRTGTDCHMLASLNCSTDLYHRMCASPVDRTNSDRLTHCSPRVKAASALQDLHMTDVQDTSWQHLARLPQVEAALASDPKVESAKTTCSLPAQIAQGEAVLSCDYCVDGAEGMPSHFVQFPPIEQDPLRGQCVDAPVVRHHAFSGCASAAEPAALKCDRPNYDHEGFQERQGSSRRSEAAAWHNLRQRCGLPESNTLYASRSQHTEACQLAECGRHNGEYDASGGTLLYYHSVFEIGCLSCVL